MNIALHSISNQSIHYPYPLSFFWAITRVTPTAFSHPISYYSFSLFYLLCPPNSMKGEDDATPLVVLISFWLTRELN